MGGASESNMKRYMLDTNTVSHLIKSNLKVAQRIVSMPMTSLCISVITEGELLFGLSKRPDSKQLHLAVREFLRCITVLPWDSRVAKQYGTVRASLEKQGKTLSPLDLLIAAHALSVEAVLVTNDHAFNQLSELHLEDWTI
jgi:tRNA(fMet)-specific endonuclease VapC